MTKIRVVILTCYHETKWLRDRLVKSQDILSITTTALHTSICFNAPNSVPSLSSISVIALSPAIILVSSTESYQASPDDVKSTTTELGSTWYLFFSPKGFSLSFTKNQIRFTYIFNTSSGILVNPLLDISSFPEDLACFITTCIFLVSVITGAASKLLLLPPP
jgi:hypothetical protein